MMDCMAIDNGGAKEKQPQKIKPTIRSLSALLGTVSTPKKESSSNNLLKSLSQINPKPKSIETSYSYDELKKKKEKVDESVFCMNCKKKEDLKKLKCGHYVCKNCRGFFEAIKMPCPLCKKEKKEGFKL